MPEYVINVKSKEVLSGFELMMLEARVKHFFIKANESLEHTDTEVRAEFK